MKKSIGRKTEIPAILLCIFHPLFQCIYDFLYILQLLGIFFNIFRPLEELVSDFFFISISILASM
jgi:hypothetical protein